MHPLGRNDPEVGRSGQTLGEQSRQCAGQTERFAAPGLERSGE